MGGLGQWKWWMLMRTGLINIWMVSVNEEEVNFTNYERRETYTHNRVYFLVDEKDCIADRISMWNWFGWHVALLKLVCLFLFFFPFFIFLFRIMLLLILCYRFLASCQNHGLPRHGSFFFFLGEKRHGSLISYYYFCVLN